jgi:hypothetical protein
MKEGISPSVPEAVNFVVSRTDKPRISWGTLYRANPHLATQSLLSSASSFIQEHGGISQRLLAQANERTLSKAITNHYPGGFKQLKIDSGIADSPKKPFDLSKSVVRHENGLPYDRRGRVIWTVLVHQDQEIFNNKAEEIAKNIVAEGKELSEDTFRELNMTGYLAAVNTYYPEGMRGLKQNLGLEVGKPFYYWHNPQNIEEEALRLVAYGSNLSQQSLSKAGASSLNAAIEKHYPGGLRKLREKLGVKNPSRGRNYWTPEKIEEEVGRFVEEHGDFSSDRFNAAGQTILSHAVGKYPGGSSALREKLGMEEKRKPNGYWNNPKNIESEAKKAVELGSNLSGPSLSKMGLTSLDHYISNYPGGLPALRDRFGIEQSDAKPSGYWTEETIEKEAKEFFVAYGVLSQKAFKEYDRQGLHGAISQKYPGRLTALKKKLGITVEQKHNFWTQETIESEARAFVAEHGDITHKMLRKADRGDLSAKVHSYPGGMGALRAILGFEKRNKPTGYWTEEKIEEEAKTFLEEFGHLSQAELISKGRSDLVVAIGKKYPGKLWGLKVKLGLAKESNVGGYWTKEKLMEEARAFFSEFGVISQPMMTRQGRSHLSVAIIRNYPGGITALLKDLGLPLNQTQKGLYTLEKIKEIAIDIISEHGDISYMLLKSLGKSGFGAAIAKKYPGKMIQLRLDLGLSERASKPVGYWTIDRIEKEAREFYEKYGALSQRALIENGRQDLQGAISSRYPGKLTALQERLGIPVSVYVSRQESISSDQARDELSKLLEEENEQN